VARAAADPQCASSSQTPFVSKIFTNLKNSLKAVSAISYQENLALLRQNVETLLAKAPIGARTLVLEFDSMLPTSIKAKALRIVLHHPGSDFFDLLDCSLAGGTLLSDAAYYRKCQVYALQRSTWPRRARPGLHNRVEALWADAAAQSAIAILI
jgi:hypothetical protein